MEQLEYVDHDGNRTCLFRNLALNGKIHFPGTQVQYNAIQEYNYNRLHTWITHENLFKKDCF